MMAVTKSERRKRELLEAASSMISERGLSGVSVRSVAERAEVSAGSVLYHFGSFDQLVEAAVRGALEEFIDRRRRRIEDYTDPVARLRAAIEAGIPEVISDDLRIVYEAAARLRDHPRYRPHMTILVERQVGLLLSIIEAGRALGVFEPRLEVQAIAENLVALEDAYDLYLLDPDNWQRDRYLENTIAFAELALGCSLGGTGTGTGTDTPASEAQKGGTQHA